MATDNSDRDSNGSNRKRRRQSGVCFCERPVKRFRFSAMTLTPSLSSSLDKFRKTGPVFQSCKRFAPVVVRRRLPAGGFRPSQRVDRELCTLLLGYVTAGGAGQQLRCQRELLGHGVEVLCIVRPQLPSGQGDVDRFIRPSQPPQNASVVVVMVAEEHLVAGHLGRVRPGDLLMLDGVPKIVGRFGVPLKLFH